MPIFLLTPRDLGAPDWRNSTVREPVQVEAVDQLAARRRAAFFFSTAADVSHGQVTGSIPWHQGGLVSVRVVGEPDPAVKLILAGDVPDTL
ncbi:MAG: hypothetical protein JWM26_435 [Betaproteobacteria bacterium]|nr:hypothetical protein [Betaproteobacteria bacterium]